MGKVIEFSRKDVGHRLADFDVLDCPRCEAQVPPSSVSKGPSVAYRCKCGRSWRINKNGEETHLRLPPGPAYL